MPIIPDIRTDPMPEDYEAKLYCDADHPVYEGEAYWIIDGICYCEKCLKERMRLA